MSYDLSEQRERVAHIDVVFDAEKIRVGYYPGRCTIVWLRDTVTPANETLAVVLHSWDITLEGKPYQPDIEGDYDLRRKVWADLLGTVELRLLRCIAAGIASQLDWVIEPDSPNDQHSDYANIAKTA